MPVVPILEDDDLDPSWLHDPLEYHGPPTPVWGTPEYDLGYEVNSSEAETEIDPTVQSSAGAPGAIMRLALRLIDPVTGIDEQTEQ